MHLTQCNVSDIVENVVDKRIGIITFIDVVDGTVDIEFEDGSVDRRARLHLYRPYTEDSRKSMSS